MKKIIITTFIALTAILNPVISSSQAFHEGDKILGFGLGFGSSLGGYTYGSSIPAISAFYEQGNWTVGGPGVISLGGYIGYKSFTYDENPYYNYSFHEKWNYTIIGIRSAYHYTGLDSKDWDVYGGLMLSYNIVNYSYTSNPPNPAYDNYYTGSYGSYLGLSLYIGGRYFVSEKVALYAELGYGVAYFNLGAALKL
jgi:hypothetical protein